MFNAIEVKELSKFFYSRTLPWQKRNQVSALLQVNLEVKSQECFALLGPNGAGKTTLLKILATSILPTKGNAYINGCSITEESKIKPYIGFIGSEERSLYWRLTGRQNLEFFACLYDIPASLAKIKINRLAEMLGILKQLDQRSQVYSSGTKQKIEIIRSLLHEPRVLLIDEPTKSLDPYLAQKLRTFIREELIKKQKKTVLLSTHQISEAETLADRIAIMNKGRIKACGTPEELKNNAGSSDATLLETFVNLIDDSVKEV